MQLLALFLGNHCYMFLSKSWSLSLKSLTGYGLWQLMNSMCIDICYTVPVFEVVLELSQPQWQKLKLYQ